jgi:DNA-directed RNA polymerase beta subunit
MKKKGKKQNRKGGEILSNHYKFHKNKAAKKNPHYFMSEELLIPRANNSDTQRINMFANHLNQWVHLVNPEFPKVFTNFENQVGEYSVAYKKARDDFEVIAKIRKNDYNYSLIVQYRRSKLYDVIHFKTAVNITEDYGYALHDCIPDVQPGTVVREEDYVYKSSNYDNDGNFAYGTNLKAVFLPYKNLTYEDGIVIGETAAKKLTAYKVEQTMFSVNSNDILLNIYGDSVVYKSFPKIGDEVSEKMLAVIRRRDHSKVLYDFQADRLNDPDNKDDTIIYTGGGKIVDIDIFSNRSIEDMERHPNEFQSEVLAVYRDIHAYYKKMAEELEKIIPVRELTEAEQKQELKEMGHVIKHPLPKADNKNKYTDEVSYMWKASHEFIDPKVQWRHEGKSFDNLKIRFTILKEHPLTIGAKLTGRYGNKGTIAMIVPDEEMPVTEDGIRADVCLNPLGILNRLNIAQIQEQYINFMASNVLKKMGTATTLQEQADEFFDFVKAINKEQYEFLVGEYETMTSGAKKTEFISSVLGEGIYIHQPPFFNNTTMEQFEKLFKSKPHLVEKHKFVNIEKPMVMGDMYFIRLKHESSNKASARSTALNNIKYLPSKSTLKKEKKIIISQTPIRLGEMEVTNLMITKKGQLVEKLLRSYSTSEEDRNNLITDLLVERNPLNIKIDGGKDYSTNRQILQKYLNILELDLED